MIEGAKNNLPDEQAHYAAREIKGIADEVSEGDILLVLISGGGSALLPYPVHGITLQEKLAAVKALSSAGATINELNTVRKNLSGLKGGKLAQAAYPASVLILLFPSQPRSLHKRHIPPPILSGFIFYIFCRRSEVLNVPLTDSR